MEEIPGQLHDKRHPIQVAARRAGVSPHVLRAWERRYRNVVSPGRSTGGRRLYSDADIERLRLLHEATRAGRRIGDVAELSIGELEALLTDDRLAVPEPATVERSPVTSTINCLNECLDATLDLDQPRLERCLNTAALSLPLSQMIDEVVVPLMQQVGHMWSEGTLTPGHEHFVSSIVSRLLMGLATRLSHGPDAPRLVVTTPRGTHHAIGGLLAALTSAAVGWHVTFLGSDLPARDIAAAAEKLQAECVALSVIYPADAPQIHDELRSLRRDLGPEVGILVGGRAAATYRTTLAEIDAMLLLDLGSLQQALEDRRAT
jgi:DNA-binding transcriptional MerR regulator/methylmalonyl-CoA mutase cobalamin-binding subunit